MNASFAQEFLQLGQVIVIHLWVLAECSFAVVSRQFIPRPSLSWVSVRK